jgi:NTP pyrophosphatase (non-canonical NTP hydrolase)
VSSPSLNELTERLNTFRDERDWRQFHSLKELIASVSIEAGELLELAQWKRHDEVEVAAKSPEFRQRLSEECADVLLYLLMICEQAGIDLAAAAAAKIELNAAKYPVEKAKGKAVKYTDL